MTQDELAKKLGYKSKTSINKIEQNWRNLTQSKIKAIADALDTTPMWIMGWQNDEELINSESARFADFLKDHPEFIPVIAQIMDLPTDQADTAARVLRALKDGGEK